MEFFVKRFSDLTTTELYALLHVRNQVFVVEQDCVYQDLDFHDQEAIHVWLQDDNGNILALSRICPAGGHMERVSIGRMITTVRGKGYGLQVMRLAIKVAKIYFNPEYIDIEAQEYAKEFYEKVGFEQSSDSFILDGIPHIKMTYHFNNQIRVRKADLGDVNLIANVVCMALGEEQAEKLRGGVGIETLEQVVADPNTVYSYKNSLVAEVNCEPLGAIISYDGAKMWELRGPAFDIIERNSGVRPQLEEETQAGECYLDSVAVMPNFRGMGIGSMLIQEAANRAFEAGFEKVALLVDADNPNAEKLYTRLGFKRDNPVTLLGHEMWHMVLCNF